MKEAEVEGEGKGHSVSQPQLCSFCKNIKALLRRTSQHGSPASLFDGCVSRPRHSALLWQVQKGLKRNLAFNQIIPSVVKC